MLPFIFVLTPILIISFLGYKTFVIQDATLPVNLGNSVQETIKNFKKNNVGYGELEEFF